MKLTPDIARPFAPMPMLKPALRLHKPATVQSNEDGDRYEEYGVYLPQNGARVRDTEPSNKAVFIAVFILGLFAGIAFVRLI